MFAKEKIWKRIFNTNRELSQNCREKQIMPSKTTVNWLFAFDDIWCYLVIACLDWKISVFQQTVIRVYYILKMRWKLIDWDHSRIEKLRLFFSFESISAKEVEKGDFIRTIIWFFLRRNKKLRHYLWFGILQRKICYFRNKLLFADCTKVISNFLY